MFEFKLPDLGEGIHEGEIIEWHVEKGDHVQEDGDLLDVETDKTTVTIPSPKSGVIKERKGEVGDIIETGEVIVVIDTKDDGEQADGDEKDEDKEEQPKEKDAEPEEKDQEEKEKKTKKSDASDKEDAEKKEKDEGKKTGRHKRSSGPVPAAPATRRLAREMEVDINRVDGSGPGGRILDDDVRAAAEGKKPETPEKKADKDEDKHDAKQKEERKPSGKAPYWGDGVPYFEPDDMPDFEALGPVERAPLRSIRRKTALRMVTSKTMIPHVTHHDEADITELEQLRARMRERYGDTLQGKLTLLPFIVKALIAGLKEYPGFNASLDPQSNEIIYKHYYNIGIAVDSGKGLVVPVIHDADKKSISELAGEIEALAKAAREGDLELSQLQGGSCTITNVGAIGGTAFTPAINYPESSILGLARQKEKPVVREGRIVARLILPLSVSFDHRIEDGAQAARFVKGIVKRLEDPELLSLEM